MENRKLGRLPNGMGLKPALLIRNTVRILAVVLQNTSPKTANRAPDMEPAVATPLTAYSTTVQARGHSHKCSIAILVTSTTQSVKTHKHIYMSTCICNLLSFNVLVLPLMSQSLVDAYHSFHRKGSTDHL